MRSTLETAPLSGRATRRRTPTRKSLSGDLQALRSSSVTKSSSRPRECPPPTTPHLAIRVGKARPPGGATAPPGGRALPTRMARCGVVGGGHSLGRADDFVTDDERRACKSPLRDFRVGVRRRVARPDNGAVSRVERIQDAGSPKGVDATVAESRRRARPGAGVRLVEPNRVFVSPHSRAGGQVVARHHLIVATLLLGIDK